MLGTHWLALFLGCLGTIGPPAGDAGAEPEVVCPAIRLDDRPRHPNSPLESRQQPELVVLGKAREVKGTDILSTYEIVIEKVLYGNWTEKMLRFSGYGRTGRWIFALAPARYEGGAPFQLRYEVDAAEEKAMKALYKARLDFNVLASRCIFIGKETERIDGLDRTVEALRPLSGDAPKKGQRVTVHLGRGEEVANQKAVLHKEPGIYFIRTIAPEPQRGQSKSKKEAKKIIYYAFCRQPLSRADDVSAALKRRDEHPILERMEDGKKVRYREVMFRGSTAECIELLGSESEAAVALGARKLIHEARTSQRFVNAAIENRLLRLADQRGDSGRVHNLIRVLGSLPGEPAKADLRRLIDKHIKYLTDRADKADKTEVRGHEDHTLSWLLQRLGEEEVYRRYGRSVIRLRDRAKGQCKRELQLALDECRIEDHFEVQAALARMKDVKPLRSPRILPKGGTDMKKGERLPSPLTDTKKGERIMPPDEEPSDRALSLRFASDGKTVRTVKDNSIYLWDAATLRLRKRIVLPGSLEILTVREPDGKYLLCRDTARKDEKPTVRVVDADNGRIIATLELPKKKNIYPEMLHWIKDHEVIGFGDGFLVRFDGQSGKILGQVNGIKAMPGSRIEMSADGKSLDWLDCDPQFALLEAWSLNLRTGRSQKVQGERRLPSRYANVSGLVPGGKYVFAGDPDLYLLDRRTLKVVAHRDFRKTDILDVDFTADGQRYAIVTGGRIFFDFELGVGLQRWDPGTRSLVRIHDTRSGKTLAAVYPATRWVKVRLRPDGRRLAVINDDATIELWDLSSLAKP